MNASYDKPLAEASRIAYLFLKHMLYKLGAA